MSDVTVPTFATQAEAAAYIAKQQSEIVANREAIANSKEKFEQATEDLKAAQRAIGELNHRLNLTKQSAPDIELRQFEHRSGGDTVMRAVGRKGALDEWQPGLFDGDAVVSGDWHRKAIELRTELSLCKLVPALQRKYGTALRERYIEHMRGGPESVKRLFTDAASLGADWIDSPILPGIYQELRAQRRLEGLFRSITTTSKSFQWPFATSTVTPYLYSAPTTDRSATDLIGPRSGIVPTAKTMTPAGFAVISQVFDEAMEDATPEVMSFLRAEIVAALRDGFEDAIVNGDTAGTHQDGIANWNPRSRWAAAGLGGSDDHRKACIGLRARAFDVSSASDISASQTYAGLLGLRAALDGAHGIEGDLLCLPSFEWYLGTLLGLDQVATVDKYGSAATVLTGEVARVGGMRIVLSPSVTNDLNASGLYDNTTTTKGSVIVVNRNRFVVVERAGARVEADKEIRNGTIDIVARMRKTFDTPDSASTKNVALGYNV